MKELTDEMKLQIAAAVQQNGGVLPDHMRGKFEGYEMRAGEVVDLNAADALLAADPQDVFGRIVNGNLHLFDRRLTAADKSAIEGYDGIAMSGFDGYLGTVDAFAGTVDKGLPHGGVDGFHPDATVADGIRPSEGNVVTTADNLRGVARDEAETPEAKAKLAETTENSVKGAAKPKPSS